MAGDDTEVQNALPRKTQSDPIPVRLARPARSEVGGSGDVRTRFRFEATLPEDDKRAAGETSGPCGVRERRLAVAI